jgi:hypothetical protein
MTAAFDRISDWVSSIISNLRSEPQLPVFPALLINDHPPAGGQ